MKGKRVRLDRLRDHYLSSFEALCEDILVPGDFGEHFKLTQWHRERIQELQYEIVNHIPRVLHLWFRRGFKTTFITRYSTIWRLLRNPSMTVLHRHGDAGKAEGNLLGIKGVFMYNPMFREMFPEYCPEKGERFFGTRSEFNLPNSRNYSPEPSMRAASIETNLTGDHYMHVIDDDIENQMNVNTAETRAKLIATWSDTDSIQTAPIVYRGTYTGVGTTWHAAGLYLGHIIPQFGYGCEPHFQDAECHPDAKVLVRYYPACDVRLNPFAPEILSQADLEVFLEKEKPYRFSCNYLLRPTNPEAATFQQEWIQNQPFPKGISRTSKNWLENTSVRRALSIDLAESVSKRADAIGYVIVDIDEAGRWYFRECFENRMDTYRFIQKLLSLHETWEFDAVYVDAAANQAYFSKWALREARLKEVSIPIIPVKAKHTGNKAKDQRIMACGPRWARGDCFITEGCVGAQRLIHAMVNYPAIGQDDLLDAMAQLEVMEGRARRPVAEEPGPGTFEHIKRITRQRDRNRGRLSIPILRARYGK